MAQTRCLALVTEAFGGRGGIAQYNRDFLEALSGLFTRIDVVARHPGDPALTPAGVFQTAPRGKLGYALRALFAAARRPPDVVFCGHLHLAPLAAALARLLSATLILQAHGIEAWPRPKPFERAAVERADLVLSVSRFTRSAILGWARIAPERILVLPDTVADAFGPADASALRSALGLEGKKVLLTVGRLDRRERYKGHDRVIDAIPELVDRGFDVVYLIAGEGDDRARLEERAQEKGIAPRVRFLGALPVSNLALVYRLADLFVMPSTGEGFGIAYLESSASGVPALALDRAGARDALADGALGTLVEERDLATAIARLLDAGKRNPEALAERTRARFGRDVFRAQLRAQLARLSEPA